MVFAASSTKEGGEVSYRILLLTDHPGDAGILREVLGDRAVCEFELSCVTRLSTGIARLGANDTDLILADLSLADSRGMATFDVLFATAAQTPIMILSSDANEPLAMQAVLRGAQGYLSRAYFRSRLVAQFLRCAIRHARAEAALEREKTRAEIALKSIGDAVICTDISGVIEYMNAAAERLTGWSRDEAYGCPIGDVLQLISAITRESLRNTIELVLQQNQPMGLPPHTVLIRRDGSEKAIEDSASPIHDAHGRLTGAVIVFHDVSSAQAMTIKMAHLAQHDFLTDLPNRVMLNERIARAIMLAKRYHTQLAVLFLDLDNFKYINDSLGHAAGDRLLQSVTQRLSACARSSDTISRQGGDEFVILVTESAEEPDAAATADKIIAALNLPHVIDERELHVTTSIGISIYPQDGLDAETLIMNADTAMYYAKEKGRNNYQFFSSEMKILAVERQLIEAGLRRALEKHEFVLHYQPIVNLDSGEIVGAEALLRWMDHERGLVMPDRFVPIAEACGLIVPIGQWVLREACRQAKHWTDSGLPPISIAVNISALEFRQKNFFEGVRQILQDTGLRPRLLQLEITESVLMRNAESSAAILHELKKIGVLLAMDDFGTGYSSLSYLKRFPVDILKIDRSFVSGIVSARDDGIIVSAVLSMANSLRKKVVAEGVEEQVQLDFLRERHCDEGQGYFFSRPLIADKFAELLAAEKIRKSVRRSFPWRRKKASFMQPLASEEINKGH